MAFATAETTGGGFCPATAAVMQIATAAGQVNLLESMRASGIE
jgi:hypothetical protein